MILVGAGPGLGNAVAKEFAAHELRLVSIARNANRLKEFKTEFGALSCEVYIRVADAAKPETQTEAFGEISKKAETPDVLVYHVRITKPDGDREIPNNFLLEHYPLDAASAYHYARLVTTEDFVVKKVRFSLPAVDLSTHSVLCPDIFCFVWIKRHSML